MSSHDSHDSHDLLSAGFELSADDVERFRTAGHIAVRGLLTRELAEAWRVRIGNAVRGASAASAPLDQRDTYGKAFLQTMNLWVGDDDIRRYVLARRFAHVAAQLMGVDAVRLYHDQALYKEPGGGHTPWHQDQYYWPLETDNTVTMWMPLVDVTVEMGALTFASGSHAAGYLGHVPISDESHARWDSLVRERGFAVHCDALSAGDATFHAGWTLHCAGPNRTTAMREVMTVIYFPDGTRLMQPDNPNRQLDLETWFPDCKPGALAAGRLNPVVWPP